MVLARSKTAMISIRPSPAALHSSESAASTNLAVTTPTAPAASVTLSFSVAYEPEEGAVKTARVALVVQGLRAVPAVQVLWAELPAPPGCLEVVSMIVRGRCLPKLPVTHTATLGATRGSTVRGPMA